MENCRMDYRFTAILILMLVGLTLFAEPAYPRRRIEKMIIGILIMIIVMTMILIMVG